MNLTPGLLGLHATLNTRIFKEIQERKKGKKVTCLSSPRGKKLG